MVLARMGRVRQEVAGQVARLNIAPETLVVMVGPYYREGIAIRAVQERWLVQQFASHEPVSLPPASAGVLRVLAWNHDGFSAVRTFPMGRLPAVWTAHGGDPDADPDAP